METAALAAQVPQSQQKLQHALPLRDIEVPEEEQQASCATATQDLCVAGDAAGVHPVPCSNEARPSSRLQASKASEPLQQVAIAAGSMCGMLLTAGLDNRVLQWDVGCGPSVLNSVNVAGFGSEMSAMTFLQDWGILVTGGWSVMCGDDSLM